LRCTSSDGSDPASVDEDIGALESDPA